MNLERNGLEIAVIGMSGRFPGSDNLEDFWQKLLEGKELTTVFSQTNDQKTKAGAILKNVEQFDALFFGFNPREAEILDPQHRLFLECAWETLEVAGYDSYREKRPIGVFAGVGLSTYWINNIYANTKTLTIKDGLQNIMGLDKDYVPTLASYKLNLTGPSLSVGTACSSSLVAVHLACQSLLSGECDMALAAGVSVKIPQNENNLCPDEIASDDGKCRAFDAKAQGTTGGNGIGVVLLKRLEEAIADRDCIHAVIKGSAMNNDGAMKVGYTAPSETGQIKVIKAAQMIAEVDPETITYIEAHGIGTSLGDPIEVSAMTTAFRSSTQKTGFCAIGSVKTNLGHLDAAAGITGFIKTVLAVKEGLLPPSLHFETPNPQIDFENSPFFVNHQLTPWKPQNMPRRAGVNSFGIGGTNVHLILEEAPSLTPNSPSRSHQLLLLSAKTPTALDTATRNLGSYLKQHQDMNLADVAYTLQVGRKQFNYRRMLVVKDTDDAISLLNNNNSNRIISQESIDSDRSIIFMFPGLASELINKAKELYEQESFFRKTCDHCFTLLKPLLGLDLGKILYPDPQDQDTAKNQLKQPTLSQAAVFIIEYTLAQLWMSWGIVPEAMIGHGIGEYVAACLANVFSLEDALKLVVKQGQLIEELTPGSMLSVNLSSEKIQTFLDNTVSIAAINTAGYCVVSGTKEAIEKLANTLTQQKITYHYLSHSQGFNSPIMDSITDSFTTFVKTLSLNPPKIPFISTLTGNWITAVEATAPIYWGRQLRQPVQFYDGITHLLNSQNYLFLEVGIGSQLTTFVKEINPDIGVLSLLDYSPKQESEIASMLQKLGQLWLAGIEINWNNFYQEENRDRVPLPTYPFERQKYWIEPPQLNELIIDHHKNTAYPRPNLSNSYVAPRNTTESIIAEIWQEILGFEKVGIYDNFLELGGHSLLATQVTSRLQDSLQIDLSIQDLFECQTISDIASLVEKFASHKSNNQVSKIKSISRDAYRLSNQK